VCWSTRHACRQSQLLDRDIHHDQDKTAVMATTKATALAAVIAAAKSCGGPLPPLASFHTTV